MGYWQCFRGDNEGDCERGMSFLCIPLCSAMGTLVEYVIDCILDLLKK